MKKNDIKIFGKVLKEIGDIIINNPDDFFDFFDKYSESEKKTNEVEISKEVKNLDLILLVKENKQNAKGLLSNMSINELRYLIKKNHIGSIKSRANKVLVEYILNHYEQREQREFLNYEVSP